MHQSYRYNTYMHTMLSIFFCYHFRSAFLSIDFCFLGARFANYQSKVGLIKILQHYKVEVCDKTQIPYLINPKSFLLAPTDGIHVKISKVQ